MKLPLWCRPWLWLALWRRRRALRELHEFRERRARIREYGCDCGLVVEGSPAARRLRSFRVCPRLGCTRRVSTTRMA